MINAMILAMVAHMNKPYSRIIYHVGSSMSNPLSISSFRNCVIDYFIKHPLMSRQGSPIITTRNIKLLTSMNSFNRYVAIRYMIPLKVFIHILYLFFLIPVFVLESEPMTSLSVAHRLMTRG